MKITEKAILDTIGYLIEKHSFWIQKDLIKKYAITISENSSKIIINHITGICRRYLEPETEIDGLFMYNKKEYKIQSAYSVRDCEIFWAGYRSEVLTDEERIIKNIIE
jgi:hypothetical protein